MRCQQVMLLTVSVSLHTATFGLCGFDLTFVDDLKAQLCGCDIGFSQYVTNGNIVLYSLLVLN